MTNSGGKGANQAVAAARLVDGVEVRMVGCVGDDSFGENLKQELSAERVNVEGVRTVQGRSGVAVIIVSASFKVRADAEMQEVQVERDSGENRIMISPGANAHVEAPLSLESSLLIMQLEIPKEVVFSVIRSTKIPILFNPTPAVDLPLDIYPKVEILVVNEVEAIQLTGLRFNTSDIVPQAMKALGWFVSHGSRNVVITLGADGAVFRDEATEATGLVPGRHVDKVVDTTGAGDTFVGALAVYYVRARTTNIQFDLEEAVRYANRAAAWSVERLGTWKAMPSAKDLQSGL